MLSRCSSATNSWLRNVAASDLPRKGGSETVMTMKGDPGLRLEHHVKLVKTSLNMFSRINTLGVFAAAAACLGLSSRSTAIRRGSSAHKAALPAAGAAQCPHIPLGKSLQ